MGIKRRCWPLRTSVLRPSRYRGCLRRPHIRSWRVGMRRLTAVLIAALAVAAPVLPAQERADERATPRREPLPPALLREVAEFYNARGTLRVAGSLEVAPERTITGDVAITGGPSLVVAGRIAGRVVAINTDVILRPGARIDGGI